MSESKLNSPNVAATTNLKPSTEVKLGADSVLVVGEGKSCDAAISLLSEQFKPILSCEKDFRYKTLKYLKIEKAIIPPGLSLNEKIVKELLKLKVPVWSEVNYGLCHSKGHFFGITGSNGKTTSTMLLKHVIASKLNQAFALGNCGTPLCEKASKLADNSFIALELSSFMLELPLEQKLEAAVVLNLSPDHLNRYKNVKEYYKAKIKIYDAVKENGFLIFNYDDKKLLKESKNKKYRNKNLWYFSCKTKVKGVYIKNNEIVFNDNLNEVVLFTLDNSHMRFGKQNIAAVCLIAYLAGISAMQIANKISTFKGVEHRNSLVLKKDNISYINDSKATNCESTIFALNNLDCNHTILLLGGSSKNENYDRLFKVIKQKAVKAVICFGDIQQSLAASAKKYKIRNVFYEEKMIDATTNAKAIAESGDIVLLSPAAASFDEFTNFEERGDVFTNIVKRLNLDKENKEEVDIFENLDEMAEDSGADQGNENTESKDEKIENINRNENLDEMAKDSVIS